VYVDYPEGSLWVSQCDGSDRRELVRPPMLVTLPRISPDGRQVAFMGRMPGEFWKIHLISISGGRPELLLPGSGPESDPNWSPDGSQLVYAPLPWEATPGETGIQIVDLKTHSVRRLPGSECFYSPRWSPDGRYISAICQFTSGLALYDLEQEEWSVFDAFPAGFPAWSRDGSSIYLFHAFSRERGIYRVDVATGKISKVASLIGIDVAGMLGPFGLSLDPNDAPVILSDESSQEIYSLNLELP
jgi:Tol biopolymer transport system component